MKNKILLMLFGNVIIGFGISIGVYANLGIDPGMTFYYGISNVTGISLGLSTALSNIIFLLPLIFFDRKRIGIATMVNMLFMGYIVDFFNIFIFQGVTLDQNVWNIIILLIGIILQSFGVALYSSTQLGQSPLDGIPNVLIHLTGKGSYRLFRVIQDVTLVSIGFLCNSKIGLGTILLMTLTGPFIHFFQERLNRNKQ